MKSLFKKVWAAVLVVIMLMPATNSFAVTQYFSMDFYTGNIYLANDETNSVIIKNVRKNNYLIAEEPDIGLEYSDLPIIKENVFSKNGEKLSFDTINTYLLDQKVSFIVARGPAKVRILYMEFTD